MVLPLKSEPIVTVTELIQPLSRWDAPSLDDLLSKVPANIEDNYHDSFDPVTFDQELIKRTSPPRWIMSQMRGPFNPTLLMVILRKVLGVEHS